MVDSSPRTALLLFQALNETGLYSPALGTFARNFLAESIANKRSFLYHEAEGYQSGLIGYDKPLTTAMFGKYEMVDALDGMLDPHYLAVAGWDADQLAAYTRVLLLATKSYVTQGHLQEHSFVLHRAYAAIARNPFSLYKLNGDESAWDSPEAQKLDVCVKLLVKAIEVVGQAAIPVGTKVRRKKLARPVYADIYQMLADTAYEIILAAAAVRTPKSLSWSIQNSTVWNPLFEIWNLRDPAGKLVRHIVRRKIYDDIVQMESYPNYKGAKLIGLSLNVLGHRAGAGAYDRDNRALQKVVLGWLKRNYSWLYVHRPDIAAHCLVDGITFDARLKRLVFAGKGALGTNKLRYTYFTVN
jgi:hypothetical protein